MRLLYNLLFVCHAAHAVRVCTTLDLGFNMLRDPALSIADVASDGMLRGFDVDMREQVLSKNKTGPAYSLATRARPPKSKTVSPGPAAYSTGEWL